MIFFIVKIFKGALLADVVIFFADDLKINLLRRCYCYLIVSFNVLCMLRNSILHKGEFRAKKKIFLI